MSDLCINYNDGRATTVNDLIDHMKDGFSVLRSPHAGLNTWNLGLAAVGFSQTLYGDGTIGADKSTTELDRYRPHYLGDEQLAELPAHQTLTRFIDGEYAGFEPDGLTALHASIARTALKNEAITDWATYVSQDRALFRSIVETAIRQGVMFVQGVEADTGRSRLCVNAVDSVDQVLDASEIQEGLQALAPVSCMLTHMFVFEALRTQKDTVYHLAGRDMMGYMPRIETAIVGIIRALQRDRVVGDLEVNIVPSAYTKIVSTAEGVDFHETVWSLSGSRDAASKRELNRMLGNKSSRERLGANVCVTHSESLGGGGIQVIKSALDIPIAAMQYRLRKLMK